MELVGVVGAIVFIVFVARWLIRTDGQRSRGSVPTRAPRPPAHQPTPSRQAAQRFTTAVVGLAYDGREGNWSPALYRAALQLRREPTNPHDRNAVAVYTPSGAQLGYVAREVAADIAPLLDQGRSYTPRSRASGTAIRRHSSWSSLRRPRTGPLQAPPFQPANLPQPAHARSERRSGEPRSDGQSSRRSRPRSSSSATAAAWCSPLSGTRRAHGANRSGGPGCCNHSGTIAITSVTVGGMAAPDGVRRSSR